MHVDQFGLSSSPHPTHIDRDHLHNAALRRLRCRCSADLSGGNVSFHFGKKLDSGLDCEADKLHVWCLICINLSNFSEENITWIAIRGSCHLLSGQLQYFWHTINVRSRLPQCNAWTMVGVNVIEICRNPLHVYLLVSSKYTFIYKMLWNLSCVSISGVRQNTFHLLRS